MLAASTSSCFAVTNLGRFEKGQRRHRQLQRPEAHRARDDLARERDVRVPDRRPGQHAPVARHHPAARRAGGDACSCRAPCRSRTGRSSSISTPTTIPLTTCTTTATRSQARAITRGGSFLDGGTEPPTPSTSTRTRARTWSLFDHNTSFNLLTDPVPPREIGSPATVRLANMGAFLGKRLEVRIADASSKRVVAFYRVPVARPRQPPTITDPRHDRGRRHLHRRGVHGRQRRYPRLGPGLPRRAAVRPQRARRELRSRRRPPRSRTPRRPDSQSSPNLASIELASWHSSPDRSSTPSTR